MVMPGANDTSQEEQAKVASQEEEQSKVASSEEEKASKEAAELKSKEEADAKAKEEAEAKAKAEDEVLQLKPAEIQARVKEGIAAYLETPEFKKAVQSEKDKSIAAEIKPFKDRISELEKQAGDAALQAQETEELKSVLAAIEDGDESQLKKLVEDNQTERRRLSSVSQQAGFGLMIYNTYQLAQENDLSFEDLLKTNPTDFVDLKEKVRQMTSGKAGKVVKEKEVEIKRLNEEVAELKRAPLKLDKGVHVIGGGDTSDLSPTQLIEEGLKERERHKEE